VPIARRPQARVEIGADPELHVAQDLGAAVADAEAHTGDPLIARARPSHGLLLHLEPQWHVALAAGVCVIDGFAPVVAIAGRAQLLALEIEVLVDLAIAVIIEPVQRFLIDASVAIFVDRGARAARPSAS